LLFVFLLFFFVVFFTPAHGCWSHPIVCPLASTGVVAPQPRGIRVGDCTAAAVPAAAAAAAADPGCGGCRVCGRQKNQNWIGYFFFLEIKNCWHFPPSSTRSINSQRYRDLKREKRTLQNQLQAYQAEFVKAHGRKVKYRADRAPVEESYTRYKQVKEEIEAIEAGRNWHQTTSWLFRFFSFFFDGRVIFFFFHSFFKIRAGIPNGMKFLKFNKQKKKKKKKK
jgi:hypothetical protein